VSKESSLRNVASERAVLAGVIQHGVDCFVDVEILVDEETFTLDHNKILFKCLVDAISKNDAIGFPEILSSAKSLDLNEYIERPDVMKHINGVINTPIHLENVRSHGEKIRRLQFARNIQNQLRDIYRGLDDISGDESVTEILSIAETPIQEICMSYMREDDTTPKPLGESLSDYIEHVQSNKADTMGISTGFPVFDKAIGGGLRRKCVDLVAARPKVGKSCFADNVALHVAKNLGIPVLMLDTEMSKEDHWNRIVANVSDVEINEIATGRFADDAEKIDRVQKAVEEIKDIPYDYISIAGRPFEETLSIARRWLLKNVGYDENGRLNDCLVIYDYLKLMTSESINNNLAEFQVLGFQITSLHNFCVEHDVACLSFVQLNRDGITKESTDAVSGSDRLIWLCTSFSIFKNKTEEERAMDGVVNGDKKLIPIVSRHGPGMEDEGYICLGMQGQFARINELGTIREIKRNAENRDQGIPDSGDVDSEDEVDVENF
jgi:replicative DNA helicase